LPISPYEKLLFIDRGIEYIFSGLLEHLKI